jgi:hypothetical protein
MYRAPDASLARCSVCNQALVQAAPELGAERLLEYVQKTHTRFDGAPIAAPGLERNSDEFCASYHSHNCAVLVKATWISCFPSKPVSTMRWSS